MDERWGAALPNNLPFAQPPQTRLNPSPTPPCCTKRMGYDGICEWCMQLRANHPARARRYRNTARTPLTREGEEVGEEVSEGTRLRREKREVIIWGRSTLGSSTPNTFISVRAKELLKREAHTSGFRCRDSKLLEKYGGLNFYPMYGTYFWFLFVE